MTYLLGDDRRARTRRVRQIALGAHHGLQSGNSHLRFRRVRLARREELRSHAGERKEVGDGVAAILAGETEQFIRHAGDREHEEYHRHEADYPGEETFEGD